MALLAVLHQDFFGIDPGLCHAGAAGKRVEGIKKCR